MDGKEPPEDPTEIPEFKENAPALNAPKPKVDIEKKSELQPEVPSVELPVVVSEPVTTQFPAQPTEIKPDRSPVASASATLDVN